MTRYIYQGPYQTLEIIDNGTKKTVEMGGEIDLNDDEMVADQIRRGFHLFARADEIDPASVSTLGHTPEEGLLATTPEPEPEPEPEPVTAPPNIEEEHPGAV